MRWPVTVESRTSIRETTRRINRSERGGIVVAAADDQGRSAGGKPAHDGDETDDRDAIVDSDADGHDPVVDVTTAGTADESTYPITTGSAPSANGIGTVLVVGGAGYLGSVLCRQLLERGLTVRVLDPLLYGDAGIADLVHDDRFTLVEGDARSVRPVLEAIRGVDAVIHLGGIVGDPASGIDPERTLEYNLHSTQVLASICKYHGIERFVFASTCSVYGCAESDSRRLSETASVNPVSLYARLKVQSERLLRELADDHFAPTILRMATIYGHSPRMRFDLVGNVLPAKAHAEGVIPVFGGEQYRPNVHVADAARAYATCLDAPLEAVGDTVFNVGSNQQNYRIDELATVVADCFPAAEIEYHDDRTDDRTYRVEFERIRTELGFEPDRSLRGHCLELREAFEAGHYGDYTATRYDNAETLERAPNFEDTAAVLEPRSSVLERPFERFPSSEV